jgi:hypothetical protein
MILRSRVVKITPGPIRQFEDEGYLLLPDGFSEEEVAVLRDAAKAAFEGDVWQCRQDYGTWPRDDGMPEPRSMNIVVLIDEVMPITGPLMVRAESRYLQADPAGVGRASRLHAKSSRYRRAR